MKVFLVKTEGKLYRLSKVENYINYKALRMSATVEMGYYRMKDGKVLYNVSILKCTRYLCTLCKRSDSKFGGLHHAASQKRSPYKIWAL